MISQHLIQSIGWTLIHSLWQGLGVYILLKVGMRLTSRSDVRYGMGVTALALTVACSIATFFILNAATTSEGFNIVINETITGTSSRPIVQTVLSWIDTNIIWLFRFWMLGLVAGLLRIAAGLWYINRLRRNANTVQTEWLQFVNDLSASLNILRVVTMAEAAIASPMVVGFVKPMILFPVGLLSGLTTEQVETILVHELSHIRRQDYLINLIQSVIETVLFFNPFVLLISALIREERENCCDDLVIAKGISPITYVRTLAQLEASRSSSSLALGIAGNENQLLNRIKRIMENSAKNDWGKGRLVPVALLFLGLICASWLSIGSEKKEAQKVKDVILSSHGEITHVRIAKDTPRTEGLRVLKKKDHGWVLEEPQEIEILETPAPEEFEYFHFDETPMPEMAEAFELASPFFEMPPVPGWNVDPNFEYQLFESGDSIPGFTFRLRTPQEWENFEAEFREKFKSQFKDFYNKNQKQFDKMLEEMKSNEVARRREAAEVVDLDRVARKREMNDAMMAIEMGRHDQRIAEQKRSRDMQYQDLEQLSQGFKEMALKQKLAADGLREKYDRQRDEYSGMARRIDDFKKALSELLVADGYLKSGEEIDQLNINDEGGEMTVNGKKIKEKDRLKYKALEDQYLKTKHVQLMPGRSE
jgi:bla regulator protein BlaR1